MELEQAQQLEQRADDVMEDLAYALVEMSDMEFEEEFEEETPEELIQLIEDGIKDLPLSARGIARFNVVKNGKVNRVTLKTVQEIKVLVEQAKRKEIDILQASGF